MKLTCIILKLKKTCNPQNKVSMQFIICLQLIFCRKRILVYFVKMWTHINNLTYQKSRNETMKTEIANCTNFATSTFPLEIAGFSARELMHFSALKTCNQQNKVSMQFIICLQLIFCRKKFLCIS